MKVYSLYFSPTGGTEKVTKLIAQALGEVAGEMDLSLPQGEKMPAAFDADALCVIGVPSFGGRVPAVALERLRRIKADGTMAVLIACYGNRDYDDTLLELKDEAIKCGFKPVAAIAAVTEHSIMREFGAGRPDAQDCAVLRAFACQIKNALAAGNAPADVLVKGNRPYREYNGVPLKPSADKSCNDCGICAKSCPVGAISSEKPELTDKDRCISCMRCVAICPRHARKLNSIVLFAATQKLKKACAERKENELIL
ncbi:MAG: 4Fe-4S binding protein [Ruthenibacterium sp.]